MNDKECIKIHLNNLDFYNYLSTDEKEKLCDNTKFLSFKKKETIHAGNDHCTGVILVKSGNLRAYMLSEDGREITLYRLSKGDVCILSASCVLESITFDVFIDTESDCEIYLINSSVFEQLSTQKIYVKCFALEQVTIRFSDVMWAMQQILFMGFDKRLAIFLLDEVNKNKSTILNITHEEIAKYIGSAREVVSRMLKYFESEQIVRLSRKSIEIIDKKKLQKLI